MSDRDFTIYCAPTLANIKTASLFNEENKQGIPAIYCGEELPSFSLSGE